MGAFLPGSKPVLMVLAKPGVRFTGNKGTGSRSGYPSVSTWKVDDPIFPAQQPSARSSMSAWTPDEVATWLASCGAGGLAPVIQVSAVDGMDLLSFDDPELLVKDLRCTPFAARKLLQFRDRELAR